MCIPYLEPALRTQHLYPEMISELVKQGLTEHHAGLLAARFVSEKRIRAGKCFIKEGEICNTIGFILHGKCRHFYNTKEGEVTRWIVLQNNFVTSLGSFIPQKPAVENIQAMEDCVIAIMPRAGWLSLYAEHESMREFWTKIMEANYLGMEERVFQLIAKSAEERYAWMQQNQPQFIQEVPDKYLASMLGIHPRHLSRIRAMRK